MADGKILGVVVSCGPDQPGFGHGLRLAGAALRQGVQVYLYCLDEAVRGVEQADLQALRGQGLRLFACAYAARKRDLPLNDAAVFCGLGVLNDILAATDRVVNFH